MKRLPVIAASIVLIANVLLAARPVLAADCNGYKPDSFANTLKRVACGAGYIGSTADNLPSQPASLAIIIGRFISVALSFVGVIFIVLILYGGWLWGTSRGNEEQAKQAHDLIRNSVIGIVIVFSAFVVSNFIIGQVVGFSLAGQA